MPGKARLGLPGTARRAPTHPSPMGVGGEGLGKGL